MAISTITSAGIATDTLTAVDIADDAIGTAELANDVVISTSGNITTTGKLSTPSIVQTDAQNLSGTYSTHEIIMGKTFTATGDLTVNTNLVLVNMSGTGDDVTIQDDGTATTITGTGTLEAGEMLTKEKFDLTNMTGVLGSAVTGGSGLTALGTVTAGNLSNTAIVYPAGHVIQVKYLNRTTGQSSSTSSTYADVVNMVLSITPSSTSNKILIIGSVHTYIESHSADSWNSVIFGIEQTISGGSPSVVYNTGGGTYSFGRYTTSDTDRQMGRTSIYYLDVPNTLLNISYQIQYKSMNSLTIRADKDYGYSDLVLMEVKA